VPLPVPRRDAPPPTLLEPYRRLDEAARLSEAGDHDAAIDILVALREGPLGAVAERRLIDALRRKGDVAGARDAVAEAIGARPGDASLLRALAEIERDSGDADSAETLYRAALSVGPDEPETTASFAELLRAAGRLGEARALLALAGSRHPNHAALLETRGLVERAFGDLEAAELCLRRALRASAGVAEAAKRVATALESVTPPTR
jgi:Tfp pilus assembly protein PilF